MALQHIKAQAASWVRVVVSQGASSLLVLLAQLNLQGILSGTWQRRAYGTGGRNHTTGQQGVKTRERWGGEPRAAAAAPPWPPRAARRSAAGRGAGGGGGDRRWRRWVGTLARYGR
jgi:hypothetical protein